MYSDFRQHVLILILIAITYICWEMLGYVRVCRESRGAFDMCLIQQSLIFHSKKCYTKESHSLVKSTFLTLHSLH